MLKCLALFENPDQTLPLVNRTFPLNPFMLFDLNRGQILPLFCYSALRFLFCREVHGFQLIRRRKLPAQVDDTINAWNEN